MARSTRPDLEPATKAEVRRLRTLLRDRHARDAEGVFVCEGPRVISAAFDHGADVVECYVGESTSPDVRAVLDRAEGAGLVLRKLTAPIGDTVTPQPVFATARLRRSRDMSGLDLALVGAVISDPGNAGTLIRSAAAAGAQAVIFGAGSVDAYNPKVVRASAGARFAIRIVEGLPAVEILEALGVDHVRRLGAAASGGVAPESYDFRAPTAIVVGHEVRGLTADLPLDSVVTIPMESPSTGSGESLNVAMAGSVLLFEAARQRRTT